MSHTHPDCVQCLQVRVKALEAEIHAAEDKLEKWKEKVARSDKERIDQHKEFSKALGNLGITSINKDGQYSSIRCTNCGYSFFRHDDHKVCPTYTHGSKFAKDF